MNTPFEYGVPFSDLSDGDEHLNEEMLNSELVYDGLFLKLYKDKISLPNGQQAIREYLTHPGAVAIIPMLSDGNILLERQFRYPLKKSILEIPAGKLEYGEDSLECAKRELQEETGYTAKKWHLLGTIHPVISYSTEFIDIYLAQDLLKGQAKLDDEEFLDIFTANFAQMQLWIRNGRITDVKTIISYYWLKDYLGSLSRD